MLQRTRLTPCLLWALLTSSSLAGSWQDEIPVIQDPILQLKSSFAIGPDDVTYVVWPDWTDWENGAILLSESSDYGKTWGTPRTLFSGSAYDTFELTVDSQGVLHLLVVEFTEDDEDEYKRLFHSRSVDGGQTFSALTRIGSRENIEQIRLFTGNGRIFVAGWNYYDESDFYLYVTSDGVGWTEQAFPPGWNLNHASYQVEGGSIHVAFPGSAEMRYSRSDDNGATWQSPVTVSQGSGPYSQLPAIAVRGNSVHITWDDDRSGQFEVMYSRSVDGGLSFGVDIRMNDTDYGARSRLLIDRQGVHVVWCQYHGDNGWPPSWSSGDYGILWGKTSHDDGATWSTEQRVSQNDHIPPIDLPTFGANHPKLASYREGFAVLWHDKRDGNFDLYMRNNLPLTSDVATVSEQGGQVEFTLDASPNFANRGYVVLGSLSGVSPGFPLPGGLTVMPLNWDVLTTTVVLFLNTPSFDGFLGDLDASGAATATLNISAIPPGFVGTVMHYAFALDGPWDFASNPIAVEITP